MIGFAGLSHLGIVSSIAIASKGFKVQCFDPNPQLCSNLTRGELPVFEKDLCELLEGSKSRINFSCEINSLAKCDVVYISRDVPTNSENKSDLTPIKEMFEGLLEILKSGATLVILSQLSPGTMRELELQLSDRRPDLNFYYQVETLIFGVAVERALNPERYIVGCKDPCAPLPTDYAKLLASCDCPVLPMRYESAELAKISINICLISSLTVANLLGELCERIGADWSEIEQALRLDKRIGKYAYIKPGLGIAGGNLERDLITLNSKLAEFGADSCVVSAWRHDLAYRRGWVLRTLHNTLSKDVLSNKPRIALWGLAYKPGTHSIKNSQSLELLQDLGATPGFCEVCAYDPKVTVPDELRSFVEQAPTPLESCKGADVLIIMTAWDEFKSVNLCDVAKSLRGKLVIDPFRVLSGEKLDELKVAHLALGTPAVDLV